MRTLRVGLCFGESFSGSGDWFRELELRDPFVNERLLVAEIVTGVALVLEVLEGVGGPLPGRKTSMLPARTNGAKPDISGDCPIFSLGSDTRNGNLNELPRRHEPCTMYGSSPMPPSAESESLSLLPRAKLLTPVWLWR